jgi:CheY-like chemotaxis protein
LRSTAAAWGPLSHRLENVRVLAGLRRLVLVWQGPNGDWKHMLRCRDDMVPQAEARLLDDLFAVYRSADHSMWPGVLARWHSEGGWFEPFVSGDGAGFFAAFHEAGSVRPECTAEWLVLALPALAAAANDTERRQSFYRQRQAVLESAMSLSRAESEPELLAHATRLARRLLSAEAAACLARGSSDTDCVCLAEDPESSGAAGSTWTLNTASMAALREGHPVLVCEGREARAPQAAAASLLVAPLGRTPSQQAFLAVRSHAGRCYSAYDQFTLSVFCRQVESVLENRQLLTRLLTANRELTAAQARLVETARLQTLGEVASSVAHDFNNVLGALLGRVQLLQHASSDAGVQSALAKMERVIAEGEETVKKLQEAARGKRPDSKVTLDGLVREVYSTTEAVLRHEAQISDRKVVWLTEFLPTAEVVEQAGRLRPALRQLLTELSATAPPDSVIELRTGRNAGSDYLILTVASDPALESHVQVCQALPSYAPFALAVEQAGGFLAFASRTGECTLEARFTVRPLAEGASDQVDPLRVLVVDDDRDVRDVLSEMLITAGHEVRVAEDGADALKQFAGGRFDIVFTDLGMPGISGWQVVEQIKRDAPELPVVMVTGWGHQLDPTQVERSGVNRVLTKPFHWVTVLDTLQELVPRSQREGR